MAYLRIKRALLEQKDQTLTARPVIPPLLSEAFEQIHDVVSGFSQEAGHNGHDQPSTARIPARVPGVGSVRKVGRWIAVANITTMHDNHDYALEDEVRGCFEQLQGDADVDPSVACSDKYTAHLAAQGLTLSNCANVNIFLSSMDLFARVNAVYASYFGSSPPARACVAVDLPDNVRVKLDAVAFIEQTPSERQALHVQGLSYWAPANIGPYSQAIVVRHRSTSSQWMHVYILLICRRTNASSFRDRLG